MAKLPIITDSDVLTKLVPAKGFIHDYVHYAMERTDAPAIFHVGCALSLLSAVAPKQLRVWADGSVKYPNMYVLIIGDSAAARKSTALKIADNLLTAVAPKRRGHSPGSYEGLLSSLELESQQTIMESEFSRFLQQAQSNGHLNGLKLGFVDLYDCGPVSKVTSGRTIFVEQPRLGLVGCIAPRLLEQYLERSDLTGGFWSRFLILDGIRERFKPWTQPDEAAELHLMDMLGRRLEYTPGTRALHTPSVQTALQSWATNLDHMVQAYDLMEAEQRSLFGRASGLLHRTALLYAMDRYVENLGNDAMVPPALDGPQVTIDLEDMVYAATLVGVHVNSSFSVLADLADSKDMRDRRNVLRAIGSTPSTVGAISERAKLLKGRTLAILDTLLSQMKIGKTMEGTGEPAYYIIPQAMEADKPIDALAASLAWLDLATDQQHQQAASVGASFSPTVVPEQGYPQGYPDQGQQAGPVQGYQGYQGYGQPHQPHQQPQPQPPPEQTYHQQPHQIEPTNPRFRAAPAMWVPTPPPPAGTIVVGPWIPVIGGEDDG